MGQRKTLDPSPQSEQYKVRAYLEMHGFFIEDETVQDEGKYYTVMSVVRGNHGIWRSGMV